MRQEGMELLLPMEEFQLMGFIEIIRHLPSIYRQFKFLEEAILKKSPPAVVLIDYPGFNLRLAKRLRKKGYKGKIIQYISPTVWAWAKGRIHQMASSLDLLLCILPFEPPLFANTTLPAHYVGHPVLEHLPPPLPENKELIALFPGSRLSEIKRNAPILIEAARLLHARHPTWVFALSVSHPDYEKVLQEYLENAPFCYLDTSPQKLQRTCCGAIAKSGTVTLELAALSKPTVVVYTIPWIYRQIAQWIIEPHLPYYCIVNIIAKREVFPEFVTKPFTADTIAQAFEELITTKKESCINGCLDVQKTLGSKKASQEGAKHILEALC